MKHMKYSPGPWRWVMDKVSGAMRLLNASGYAVFWPVRDDNMGSTHIEWRNDADARLIAAAPELLEMLAETVNVANNFGACSGAPCFMTETLGMVGACCVPCDARALIRRIEGEE